LRFPGQYRDAETGLFYNYFRDYDPQTGRYVQSDPIGLAGGINPYLYARANPLRWNDPRGLVNVDPSSFPVPQSDPSPTYTVPSSVIKLQVLPPDQAPRESNYLPGFHGAYPDPLSACKHRCYYRLLRTTVIEESALHGAAQVSSLAHRASPTLSAVGLGVGLFSLSNCLKECDQPICKP
jgi:RHS repeat-associated protein